MTDITTDDAVRALARMDFAFFLQLVFRELHGTGTYQHNWHIDAIGHQLDLLRTGKNKRLVVTMPPRHLKSITISIAWVAWMLGRNPSLQFLCVSYGQELADDHARSCLRVMQSGWYCETFPSVKLVRRSVSDFATSAGGRRISTSVDGVTTGFGADIIVIDDPMKAQDTMSVNAREKVELWFEETLLQRLNNQETGCIVLVMQRLHEGDLAGVIASKFKWFELCLPAIAVEDEAIAVSHDRSYQRLTGSALHPERMSLETLRAREASTPFVFASQYQQRPIAPIGNLVKAEWLKSHQIEDLKLSGGIIYQSWDTASKDGPYSDHSACVTALVVGKVIYILNVFRGKLQFNELKAKVIALAQAYNPSAILIEDASSGTALIQSLRDDNEPAMGNLLTHRPQIDKITRMLGPSIMIEAGRLSLPTEGSWLGEFTHELLGFPRAKHDDQVDALSQLMNWLQEKDQYDIIPLAGPELIEDDGYEDLSETLELDPWL